MQSAVTEYELTPAMASVVTRNRRRISLAMYISAGLFGTLFLGIGLVAAITEGDIGKVVFGILGGAFGVTICIVIGRRFSMQAALDVASGRFLYYSGPVEIKVTESVDSDGMVTHNYHLAFEDRLVSVDAMTARRVESSGGWVGVAFTSNGDFVFEVVDRQGQPLHRARGYVPAVTK